MRLERTKLRVEVLAPCLTALDLTDQYGLHPDMVAAHDRALRLDDTQAGKALGVPYEPGPEVTPIGAGPDATTQLTCHVRSLSTVVRHAYRDQMFPGSEFTLDLQHSWHRPGSDQPGWAPGVAGPADTQPSLTQCLIP